MDFWSNSFNITTSWHLKQKGKLSHLLQTNMNWKFLLQLRKQILLFRLQLKLLFFLKLVEFKLSCFHLFMSNRNWIKKFRLLKISILKWIIIIHFNISYNYCIEPFEIHYFYPCGFGIRQMPKCIKQKTNH